MSAIFRQWVSCKEHAKVFPQLGTSASEICCISVRAFQLRVSYARILTIDWNSIHTIEFFAFNTKLPDMSDMANQGILQQQKKLPPGARPEDLADLY